MNVARGGNRPFMPEVGEPIDDQHLKMVGSWDRGGSAGGGEGIRGVGDFWHLDTIRA